MGLFHVASVLYHTMKLNIANPATGSQMLLEVDDERKLAVFMDRKIGQEVPLDSLEEGFAGYQVRISGGLDKQGFPMKQGISTAHRVRELLGKHPGYFNPKRKGERRRRSVRGAIVAQDIAVLNLVLVPRASSRCRSSTLSCPAVWVPSVRARSASSLTCPRRTMCASTSSVVSSLPRTARSRDRRRPISRGW